MLKNHLSKRDAICVAVSFNRETESLVKLGADLCELTGMRLRLINVCEPWIGGVGFGLVPIAEVNEAVQEELMVESRNRLKQLATKIPKSVAVETATLLGAVADVIDTDARANHVGLLICSSSIADHSYLPGGFSTAVNLMSGSTVPVLVVPRGLSLSLNDKPEFVVADDLSDGSSGVVRFAVQFSAKLKGHLHHVHALGLNVSQMETLLNAAVSSGRSDSKVSPQIFTDAVNQAVHKRMEERVKDSRTQYPVEYYCRVLNEEPGVAILNYLKKLPSENSIVIFGRHHMIHRKPFTLGRMPFKTMLAAKHAVLVVPV